MEAGIYAGTLSVFAAGTAGQIPFENGCRGPGGKTERRRSHERDGRPSELFGDVQKTRVIRYRHARAGEEGRTFHEGQPPREIDNPVRIEGYEIPDKAIMQSAEQNEVDVRTKFDEAFPMLDGPSLELVRGRRAKRDKLRKTFELFKFLLDHFEIGLRWKNLWRRRKLFRKTPFFERFKQVPLPRKGLFVGIFAESKEQKTFPTFLRFTQNSDTPEEKLGVQERKQGPSNQS